MNTLSKFFLLMFVGVTLQANAKYNDTVERTFDLTAKGQLVLENMNGEVEIKSWSKNQVMVIAEISARDEKARQQIKIKTKQSGNKISVVTEYDHDDGWGRNHTINGSVDYKVMVPVNMDLQELDVINGSLSVKNVSGELNADVVNGSVTASGLASDVEVDSVNGKVELTFDDNAANIEISVDTVNGGIRLYVPENFGAKVDASTGNGSIKTDFGLHGEKSLYYGTDLKGQFGDASSTIELESVNGSIKILQK